MYGGSDPYRYSCKNVYDEEKTNNRIPNEKEQKKVR